MTSLRSASAAFLAIVLAGCVASSAGFGLPLPDAEDRPTPLSFGLYVTPDPAENPIDPPERFTGYHAGTDFEIFEGEEDAVVPVYAICRGEIAFSGKVEGYGGLTVQRCRLAGEEVTVLYGHLAIDSLPDEGDVIDKGHEIARLADHKSIESGFTRKHLHLGIRRGTELDFLGYVREETELENFIDPLTILPM